MSNWTFTTEEYAKRKVIMVGVTEMKPDLTVSEDEDKQVQHLIVMLEGPDMKSQNAGLCLEYPMTAGDLSKQLMSLAQLILIPPE